MRVEGVSSTDLTSTGKDDPYRKGTVRKVTGYLTEGYPVPAPTRLGETLGRDTPRVGL